MDYINTYESPMGKITLASDGTALTGLWFEFQKYYAAGLASRTEKSLPIFHDAAHWLDIYFSGREPDFKLPLHFNGSEFQKEVWDCLCAIPYGETVTYGDIARRIAEARGISQMSARAVGVAVGRNKISIIVPCHRVVGADGSLTGYAGGVCRKEALLRLEVCHHI